MDGDRDVGAPEPGGPAVDLGQLERIAAELWHSLPAGAVVWLSGDLGAGKTTFVQAVTRAAGAVTASSPSYALVHEYASPRGTVYHVDCFRLNTPDEALDLDFPDMVEAARLLLIEWPERAGSFAPPPDAHLRFAHTGSPDTRYVERVR